MTQLTASLPPGTELSQDKRERLAAVVSEHLGALQPGMQATLIEVAARVFTAEELEAMIAFYGSEQGASIMAKTQPMMADFMGEFAPEMQAAQQAMLPEIMAILMEP